jgi:hypothetical protein
MTLDEERSRRREAYYTLVPHFIPHVKRVEPRYTMAEDGKGRLVRVSNPRMGECGVCRLPSIDCRAPEPPQSVDGLGLGVIAHNGEG